LLGLRHDAVVGGDYDDGDVGDLGAAGAHLGKRLVAGRVEEGDGLAVVLDAPGADDLRDAASLGGGDVALANLVEQRRLAVVDVPHDGDDRSARHQVVGVVGLFEQLAQHGRLGAGGQLDGELHAVVDGEQLGHGGLEGRVDRGAG